MHYSDHACLTRRTLFLSLITWVLASQPAFSQGKNFEVSPILVAQLWTTYTHGDQVVPSDSVGLYDGRANIYVRRIRLGMRAKINERWRMVAVTSFDNFGKDDRSGALGTSTTRQKHPLTFWNLWAQYKVMSSDALYITAGYIPFQVSRQHITAFLRIPSFEKPSSQNYIRRHLVDAGHGRAIGVNLGGQLKLPGDHLLFTYDGGIFNPSKYADNGATSGHLLTLKIGVQSGQNNMGAAPMIMRSFTFERHNNFQLNTSAGFRKNDIVGADQYTYGVDAMINYEGFELSGEWYIIGLKSTQDQRHKAATGFIRLGYLYPLIDDRYFQPAVTYSGFLGATTLEDQHEAGQLGFGSGKDQSLEMAFNYYFSRKVKLTLAYTHRWGDQGENPNEVRTNDYFYQEGIGYFNRPAYWGLGLLVEI